MNNRARTVVLLMLAWGVIGCGGNGSPSIASGTAPSPITGSTTLRLNGYVYDTAFRPVAGAAVEVLDGPQAGMAFTSESDGHFAYMGTFSTAVTIRVTKSGYTSATKTVNVVASGAWVSFALVSIVPAVDVTGNYLLTIAADSSCTMLPDDVRTRSYSVQVKPGNTTVPGYYDAIAGGAEFAPLGAVFQIGVSGNYVAISTAGEGPLLVESLGSNRYIAYSVEAGVTDVASGTTTISTPFTGTIEYCELPSPVAQYYDCSRSYQRREQCTANNGRLTLTRR